MEKQKTELKMIRMSEVESQEVKWLWYPFIPYGKLTIIQGDPGDGKTTLVLNIAAKLSKGESLDSDMNVQEPVNVIYQTAEDGLADTVKPRLEIAGADCEKILVIDESDKSLSMADERLEEALAKTGAKVLILDPIQAYLGGGMDMNEKLEQKQATLQSDNQALKQMQDRLQKDNAQLEKQQEKLKSSIDQMVQSEKLLQRDVRKYDEKPEWQLPEPGAFASAKSFRDKVALPLVNKLKELVKSLTIQCVRLKEEVLQLRDKVKHLTSDVEFYKGKIRDMSTKTELLQEKADDLECVKRYAGAEQINTIISKVKEQERMEQQARQYHRSYGAR